jgi:murein DD-endopeptidase MepM/ murein hydrolase activator NlpD
MLKPEQSNNTLFLFTLRQVAWLIFQMLLWGQKVKLMTLVIRDQAAQHVSNMTRIILGLKQVSGMRRRYVLTRQNRLRLRYYAAMSVLFFAPFLMALIGTSAQIVQHPARLTVSFSADQGIEIGGANESQDVAQDDDSSHVPRLSAHISEGMRRAQNAIKRTTLPLYEQVTFESGDTLSHALSKAGITEEDATGIIRAMRTHVDPRQIRAGQSFDLHFARAQDGQGRFIQKIDVPLDVTRTMNVQRANAGFTSGVTERPVVERIYARKVRINTSLYASAAQAGVPPAIIAEMIKAYSWDVDFQRDIQVGDRVEIMYKVFETEEGHIVRAGNFAFANLSIGGKSKPIFRFEMGDGQVDYFKPDGRSLRKTLLTTPIDGARISSGFGMRHHPILGYNKMHKGVDFAAATGTPVFAAGDGVIDYIGRQNGYGNYIRLRHNAQLKTAYAHLSRFARGVNKGTRVRQGQVIGYVGSTGRSTGPHLHYETLVNDSQVNPRSVDLPTGRMLEGPELRKFKSIVSSVEQEYAALTQGIDFADNSAGSAASRVIR